MSLRPTDPDLWGRGAPMLQNCGSEPARASSLRVWARDPGAVGQGQSVLKHRQCRHSSTDCVRTVLASITLQVSTPHVLVQLPVESVVNFIRLALRVPSFPAYANHSSSVRS